MSLGESNGAFDPFPENAWINTNGQIDVLAGTSSNNSFVSIEGVEFYVG